MLMIISKLLKLRKNKQTILSLFVQHVENSVECVNLASEVVKDYLAGKDVKEKREKIEVLEDENDKINAALNKKLFKGDFLPYTNEDWSKLASLIDTLSDISERVSKLVQIKTIKVSENVEEKIVKLADYAVKLIGLIHETIIYMRKDFELATSLYDDINRLRHEARDLEYKIYHDLFTSKLKLKDMLLIKEIVYWLAQLANTSKEIGKHVNRISVKYKY